MTYEIVVRQGAAICLQLVNKENAYDDSGWHLIGYVEASNCRFLSQVTIMPNENQAPWQGSSIARKRNFGGVFIGFLVHASVWWGDLWELYGRQHGSKKDIGAISCHRVQES